MHRPLLLLAVACSLLGGCRAQEGGQKQSDAQLKDNLTRSLTQEETAGSAPQGGGPAAIPPGE